MSRIITDEHLQEIAQYRQEKGTSWKEAILHFGRDYENTKSRLRKKGLWEEREVVKLDKDQIKQIFILKNSNLSAREIAESLSVPQTKVEYQIARINRHEAEKTAKTNVMSDWLRRPLI